MPEPLQVWLGDVHVADLEPRGPGSLRCTYTEQALARWPRNAPVISCSLPLDTVAAEANPYCRGLLPEGQALDALARRADVPVSDTHALLARFGRDIAGALVIGHGPPDPSRHAVERYDDHALEEEVADLDSHPLGVRDDSELSLAGLQNKLLLVHEGTGWGRPLHGRPSTHILKVEDPRFPGLVAAEAGCLLLARELGLTSIDLETVTLADQACLIVSRFDREEAGGEVRRVHQEDLCQATGIDPGGRRKYQSRGGGGPGFAAAARLLDTHAAEPLAELERLVEVMTYTLVIGNADAHAKNLAFLHTADHRVALAPLYDTVPTLLWPKLRAELAMAINGRYDLLHTDRHDLVDEAVSWTFPRKRAEEAVLRTLERIEASVDVLGDERLVRLVAHRAGNLRGGSTPGLPA